MLKKILVGFLLFCLSIISYAADYHTVVAQMNQKGDALIEAYDAEHALDTMEGFSALYFDHYEGSGMEIAVASLSPAVNAKTENLFSQLISASGQSASPAELQKTWNELKAHLTADLELVRSHTNNSFTQAFVQSFSILLREGFEALIIVTALLAYLRRSSQENKTQVIHYGVGSALLASGVMAILFATIFKTLGKHREAMEGIVMLTAAAVMFYVSYWLFAKREAAKWQGFIKNKMNQALTSSNMFALGLTAFLAVFREGAETILFYQALLINMKSQWLGVATGFGTGCFALLLLYFMIQRASIKIPYRLFFTITAIFLYYMAFSFIGGGILELQMAGWIDVTPIKGLPSIEWLGIFPAWQNIGAQLLFLIPTVGVLCVKILYNANSGLKITQ